jgi:hypothetical protein
MQIKLKLIRTLVAPTGQFMMMRSRVVWYLTAFYPEERGSRCLQSYYTTWYHIPEDCTLHIHWCANVKLHVNAYNYDSQ